MSDNLPYDVLVHVFFRLPVKSLIRCQTVCKHWHSTISDPEFIKIHANHAIHKAIVLSTPTARTFSSLRPSINDSNNLNLFPVWEDSIPFRSPSVYSWRIVGSCEGLLLGQLSYVEPSSIGPNLFLYNPSLRKHIEIQANDSPHHPKVVPWSRSNRRAYGLGFDSINDDYKVLEILIVIDQNSSSIHLHNSIASVFSTKFNTWKCVEDFPYCVTSHLENLAWTNDSFHFIGWKKDGTCVENTTRVIALNPANEKTHLVSLPEGIEIKYESTRLAALYGCLYVIDNLYSDKCFNIWMMKEYGVQSSWMLLASIPHSSYGSVRSSRLFPVSVVEDGQILFSIKDHYWTSRGDLRVYDPMLNKTTRVIIDETEKNYETCLYKETLVWPTIGKNLKAEFKWMLRLTPAYLAALLMLLCICSTIVMFCYALVVMIIDVSHCKEAKCFLVGLPSVIGMFIIPWLTIKCIAMEMAS